MSIRAFNCFKNLFKKKIKKEENCEITGDKCSWTSDFLIFGEEPSNESYDDSEDVYCSNCFRWRDFSKEE